MSNQKVNGHHLHDAMTQGVSNILSNVIEGSIESLEGPGREISARLALAARRNRPQLVQACKDQLQLLVKEQELRTRFDSSEMTDALIGVGIDSLISGAVGGLGSLL